MGIQSICRVDAQVKPVKPDGTFDALRPQAYYFRGSNVYKASGPLATAAGIQHIPSDKFDGTMPLTPIKDLIQAGIVERISVVVLNATTKKKRRYSLIIDKENSGKIYDGAAAEILDGKEYILTKGAATTNMGQIVDVGSSARAYNP